MFARESIHNDYEPLELSKKFKKSMVLGFSSLTLSTDDIFISFFIIDTRWPHQSMTALQGAMLKTCNI